MYNKYDRRRGRHGRLDIVAVVAVVAVVTVGRIVIPRDGFQVRVKRRAACCVPATLVHGHLLGRLAAAVVVVDGMLAKSTHSIYIIIIIINCILYEKKLCRSVVVCLRSRLRTAGGV